MKREKGPASTCPILSHSRSIALPVPDPLLPPPLYPPGPRDKDSKDQLRRIPCNIVGYHLSFLQPFAGSCGPVGGESELLETPVQARFPASLRICPPRPLRSPTRRLSGHHMLAQPAAIHVLEEPCEEEE